MTEGDGVDRLLDDLARWMGADRVDRAIRARGRERWLRQQAVEDARFAGIALDLAERGEPVGIRTVAGRTHHGRIVAVATDFVVVEPAAGGGTSAPARVTLIALAAIAFMRPTRPPATDPMGDRESAVTISLAETLATLAADQPDVQLVVTGVSEVVAGQLRAVGNDVLTLRVPGQPPGTAYVRLASVTECSVFGSG